LVNTLAALFGARTEQSAHATTATTTWPDPDDEREVDGATMARWVALISGGNAKVAEAVAPAATEALRSDDEYLLWEVLADAHLAICADWKDDDSVAAGIDCVNLNLALGVFETPPSPPTGFHRCCALFRAWAGWLEGRGYRLVAIETGGDYIAAIVVRTGEFNELRELSLGLSIPLAEPTTLYDF
jgi:hypothetical protein